MNEQTTWADVLLAIGIGACLACVLVSWSVQ
jgi:hypothetical protein